MWPGTIKILHIFFNHPIQLLLSLDQDVIETFSPYASQKPFADRVGFRSAVGRFQDFNSASLRYSRESFPIFAIPIANPKARRLAEWCSLAELLRDPDISRMSRHAKVNDTPRSPFDDEEEIPLSKEEVDNRQEIAGPNILGVILQERRPVLA